MANMDELLQKLGDEPFGVLADSNTSQITVIAKNADVAVGDLFLLPSYRGRNRFYVFRTTEYANVLNRSIELNDIARNKLTMPDSYLSRDLNEEMLIELRGMVLGYAEYDAGADVWTFHKPRRLPDHLSDVYRVQSQDPAIADVMHTLLRNQLGREGLFVGHLLAGEQALEGVEVYLPPFALSHHLGVFGRTGSGKSNLMLVLLKSVLDYNRDLAQGQTDQSPASIFAIDPHDEFRFWHAPSGGADGIHGIVMSYSDEERETLVAPFYYLTARDVGEAELETKVILSRADVVPEDLFSITEFTEQQTAFANQQYTRWGEQWIPRVLMADTGYQTEEGVIEFLPSTIAAVQRRLSFLQPTHTRVVTQFDPEVGYKYDSLLPEIICALEQGRVLIVDTTLMNEMEQFLLTTVVARTLFTLRRALRTAQGTGDLAEAIRQELGDDEEHDHVGLRTLSDELITRLGDGNLPYFDGDRLRSIDELPYINIVVEEAPSVLNPERMRFGSVYYEISRQGRKFGIGLTVVSQQVSQIDQGVLTQLNTELTMALGNENERREAIRNASADMAGFERELQVMGRGQLIVSASYKEVPLPVQVPSYSGGRNS